MHHIYIIRNKLNGKLYVGQTKHMLRRWSSYKSATKSDKSYAMNHVMVRAMKKHGIVNFEMTEIETFNTQDECNEAEEFWIQYFNTRNYNIGYNVSPGGNVTSPSVSTRQKISEASKKNWQDSKYRETILQASEATRFQIGHEVSEYTKQRVSECSKGREPVNKGTKGIMKPNKTSFQKGAHTGEKNAKAKLTWNIVANICSDYNNGISYKYLAIKYGISKSTVAQIITGKTWKLE